MENDYAFDTILENAPRRKRNVFLTIFSVICYLIGGAFVIGAFLTSTSLNGDGAVAALIFGLFLFWLSDKITSHFDHKALVLVFNKLDERIQVLESCRTIPTSEKN